MVVPVVVILIVLVHAKETVTIGVQRLVEGGVRKHVVLYVLKVHINWHCVLFFDKL